MKTRMIFAVIAVAAACGCVSNDCSGKLAIRELFGAKLDEPWGGELPLNGGGGGADFVSEWLVLRSGIICGLMMSSCQDFVAVAMRITLPLMS